MTRHERVGEVRGRGLMIGVDLVQDRSTRRPDGEAAAAVLNGLRHRGILVGVTGPAENVLKIRPPLVFATEHADMVLATLDEVLASV
jgi:4-aminobutyrate aminotransferase-like enzyme